MTAAPVSPAYTPSKTAGAEGQSAVSQLLALMLEATEQRVPHFRGRAKRVAEIAGELGRILRLTDNDLNQLRVAATFHDVGYLSVPDELINKPQIISEPQKRQVDRHLHCGSQILAAVYPRLPAVSEAVLYHHERPDGTGPFGLRGDQIPLFAAIIAVAETTEAMTAPRPHRGRPLDRGEALAQLRAGSAAQFDSRVVMAATQLNPDVFDWLLTDQHESRMSTEPDSKMELPPGEPTGDQTEAQPADSPKATEEPPNEPPTAPMDRRQLMNRIRRSIDLKAMPIALQQIMSLASSSRVSIHQIADTIKQDHAIALRTLKIANSSFYARGAPLQDIQQAVLRLGLQTVRELVMGLAVVGEFESGEGSEEELNRRYFWEHSLACGLIARDLARAYHSGESEQIFTAGLLHDVGRAVLQDFLTDQHHRVRQFAREHRMPLEQAELKLLSITHADVGQQLLTQWRFPSHLINPIAGHHLSLRNMKRYVPGDVQATATVALANYLAHAMLAGHSGNEVVYPIDEMAMELGLKEETIRFVARNAVDRADEIKLTIATGGRCELWKSYKEVIAERLNMAVNVLSVRRFAGPDSYQLLFEQITQPGADKPNLAVVHLRSREDVVPCGELLSRAENEAEVGNLPVVMLCSREHLTLTGKTLSGRAHATLPVPTYLESLIETVRRLLVAP